MTKLDLVYDQTVFECPLLSWKLLIQTKQALVARIQREISRRRKDGVQHDDLLNELMNEVEYSDYDVCCFVVVLLFAGSSTTSALIPWILKKLDDFPEVRQRVQVKTFFF